MTISSVLQQVKQTLRRRMNLCTVSVIHLLLNKTSTRSKHKLNSPLLLFLRCHLSLKVTVSPCVLRSSTAVRYLCEEDTAHNHRLLALNTPKDAQFILKHNKVHSSSEETRRRCTVQSQITAKDRTVFRTFKIHGSWSESPRAY